MTKMFFRGLAVSLPAILTVVIAIWVGNFLNTYIIQPASISVKFLISCVLDESVPSESLALLDTPPPLAHCDTAYRVTPGLKKRFTNRLASEPNIHNDAVDWNAVQERRIAWMHLQTEETPTQIYVPLGPRAVPYDVYAVVARNSPPGQTPGTARAVYMDYVAQRYFGSAILLSLITISLIVITLYFIGRFVSARIGRWIVVKFEDQVLGRLPVVRNVYGSVKQVTDFVFKEDQQVSYRGVAAVQYPREGVWTIGFVTGESAREIAMAAGQRCLSVLIPTSPMPMTGFTINIPQKDVIELDMTVEQAMQFCISCGVLTPPHQKLTPEMAAAFQQLRPDSSSSSVTESPDGTSRNKTDHLENLSQNDTPSERLTGENES